MQVESSCCCFPREFVSFVHPRELVSFDPQGNTRKILQSENIFEFRGITSKFDLAF